jgi:hypothetical protein
MNMLEKMMAALAKLGPMVKAYFPSELREVLLLQSAEIDRLRADVNGLVEQLKKEA